tara:strand:+ start:1118 stop:1321 length:204 start_codon:yes stop_codon:yes gene_type:complete
MDVNPAYRVYTNLNIVENKPVKKIKRSSGLLSRGDDSVKKETSNEPLDRVRNYVTTIREARKQITNG